MCTRFCQPPGLRPRVQLINGVWGGCVSVYPSICLSIGLSVRLSVSGLSVCLSVHPSVHPSVSGLSVCLLSFCLSICPLVRGLFVRLSVHPFISQWSVCLPVCMSSVHQSVSGLSICLSVSQWSVCPSVHQSVVCLSICPSVRSSVCLGPLASPGKTSWNWRSSRSPRTHQQAPEWEATLRGCVVLLAGKQR